MRTGLVTAEQYFWLELTPSRRLGTFDQPYPSFDSPEGKRRILSLLRVSGMFRLLEEIEPRLATRNELLRFHSREYIERVERVSEDGGGQVGPAAGISAGGYAIARLAAGGCIAAVEAVLDNKVRNAFALVRPCGHHAERDRGMGMAIFGNVALAVLHAKDVFGLGRIAVVDWDVHHGNGTQAAFYDDPGVLAISIHQDRLFPTDSGSMEETGEGSGRGYNINVPLPAGSGHGAYVETISRVVLPALKAFRPALIVVASGFDACGMDPLGRMMCHSGTYRAMTGLIKRAAEDLCDGRIVLCLEGGYAPSYVPYCALATVEELAEVRTEVTDPDEDWIRSWGGHELQPAQEIVIDRAAVVAGALA